MIKILRITAICVGLIGYFLSYGCDGANTKLNKEEYVKNIDFKSINYKNFSLEQFKGQWVYFDFWASWCPSCKDSVLWLEDMKSKYKNYNIVFVTINEDKNKIAKEKFIKSLGLSLPVIDDKNEVILRKLNVRGVPTAIIVDPDGEIASVKEGFLLEKMDKYEDTIRIILDLKKNDN
jgi:thiol-disulfide isomerase/thioredoxin